MGQDVFSGDFLMVGKVPISNEPQVQPNSPPAKYLSDRNATAETFGAGIGRARQQFGAQISQLGDVLANHGIRMQEEANAAEANDLLLKADMALAEKQTAFNSLEGKNAVDALPGYMADVQKLGTDFGGSASNGAVKKQFAQNFARKQGFAVVDGGRYAAGQNKRYQSGLTLAVRSKAEQDAVAYPDSDLRGADALDLTRQSVQQQSMQEGWSEQQTNLEIQKATSNVWEKRLAALSIKDPIRAKDLYDQNKDQIDGISRVKIEAHIEQGLISQGASRIADEVITRGKVREQRSETKASIGASPEILAAIEQAESGGQPGLVSPKGALGNMQLMPETAKEEARLAGIEYDENRLRNDPEYNRLLGTRVFNRYLASYGGNTTLALAAYNAGPARVNQWLKDHGDPREGGITEAEWAQKIPFDETRRYLAKIGGKVQIASTESQVWGDDRDLPSMIKEARGRAQEISPGNQKFEDASVNRTIQRYEQDIKAPKIERDRLRKEADERQKAAQEATLNEGMAKAMQRQVNPESVWTDPNYAVLTFDQKMKLQNGIKQATKDEPMSQVSQASTISLVDRIRLPDGDPRKISDTGPIYDAYTAGALKNADFNFVMKEFNDLRTASGARLSVRQNDFFSHIRPQIDQSNPLMGKLDPTGKEQMYKLMIDVQDTVERYRKEGKNPYDLFDPAKPDYMGKPEALKPYQKSIGQSMGDISRRLTAPPNQPATRQPPSVTVPIAPALPPDQQRKSGESIADYLKRRGGQ